MPVYCGDEKVTDAKFLYGGNPYSDYEVWLTASLDKVLYSDKEYRVVIPAGVLAPNAEMASFASNKEITLTFTGNAAHALNITCDNVKDGAVIGELTSVMFTADEPLFARTALVLNVKSGNVSKDYPLTMLTTDGNTTNLYANLLDEEGNGFVPVAGVEGKLTIAADVLNSNSDPKLSNSEITVSFIGANLVTEVEKPELVNVNITVGDNFTTVAQAVKGEPYTFSLVPDDGWTVTSVKVGDTDVVADMVDGSYTIEELTSDTTIVAVLEGEYEYEDNEGTGIEAAEYGIYAWSDGEKIIIEGLSGYSDNVRVYTLGGTLVGHSVAASSRAEITVPAGVYIIRISNGQMNFGMKLIHN